MVQGSADFKLSSRCLITQVQSYLAEQMPSAARRDPHINLKLFTRVFLGFIWMLRFPRLLPWQEEAERIYGLRLASFLSGCRTCCPSAPDATAGKMAASARVASAHRNIQRTSRQSAERPSTRINSTFDCQLHSIVEGPEGSR